MGRLSGWTLGGKNEALEYWPFFVGCAAGALLALFLSSMFGNHKPGQLCAADCDGWRARRAVPDEALHEALGLALRQVERCIEGRTRSKACSGFPPSAVESAGGRTVLSCSNPEPSQSCASDYIGGRNQTVCGLHFQGLTPRRRRMRYWRPKRIEILSPVVRWAIPRACRRALG